MGLVDFNPRPFLWIGFKGKNKPEYPVDEYSGLEGLDQWVP
jgi:hypothetical protein